MKQPKTRSLRISDDIFNELMRLRLPLFGVGGQKTWDMLFNYFLTLHHDTQDWREKIKDVDLNPAFFAKQRPIIEDYLNGNITEVQAIERVMKIQSELLKEDK